MSNRKPTGLSRKIAGLLDQQPVTSLEFYERHKRSLPKGVNAKKVSTVLAYLGKHHRWNVHRDTLSLDDDPQGREKFVYFIPGRPVTQVVSEKACSEDPLDRLLDAVSEIERELRSLREIKKIAQTINTIS